MSINHYSSDLTESQYLCSSPKTSSSNHRAFFSSHLNPNSAATAGCPASPRHLYNQPNHATTSTAAVAAFCGQNTAPFSFNHNHEDEEELIVEETDSTSRGFEHEEEGIPKEPLFEKPLTPSDVGKLNRLVIPKQHAERYFPLNGGGETGEKGLILSFEDEVGKTWRFRYSYWNSSQSYVLTKGWSRFVKEKRLATGDIVLFERHRENVGRLFIGWTRRDSSAGAKPPAGGGGWSRVSYSGNPYLISQHQGSSSLPYQPPDCPHAGSIIEKQTTATNTGNSKRLIRLFGVNLEWQSEPSTPEAGSPMSSRGQTHQQSYHQYHSNHHSHTDINFSAGDLYRHG